MKLFKEKRKNLLGSAGWVSGDGGVGAVAHMP